jgi:hypothetical protein
MSALNIRVAWLAQHSQQSHRPRLPQAHRSHRNSWYIGKPPLSLHAGDLLREVGQRLRELSNQPDTGEGETLHCSGDIHLFCRQNHQWDATQNNILRVVLEPLTFSDKEPARMYYSGAEVV